MPDTHDAVEALRRLELAIRPHLDKIAEMSDTPARYTIQINAHWNEYQHPDQLRLSDLRDLLTAPTARAESATVLPERWRALIAERDAAVRRAEEAEARLVRLGAMTPVGYEHRANGPFAHKVDEDFASAYPEGWAEDYWPERRPLYAGSWERITPDAAPDGRSATLRAEDASGEAFQANTSSILPQGLSEPELFADACDCECQPGQPCLCPERDCYCGPCRVCGDNPQRTNDDTTEDDRG